MNSTTWKDFNSSLQNYNRTWKVPNVSNQKKMEIGTDHLDKIKNLEQIIGEQINLQGTF
jgi:hypothetical protein